MAVYNNLEPNNNQFHHPEPSCIVILVNPILKCFGLDLIARQEELNRNFDQIVKTHNDQQKRYEEFLKKNRVFQKDRQDIQDAFLQEFEKYR